MTLDEAKAILAALVLEKVEFVVIGSMAMAAQGLPRATHDLDLFVSPEIANLEALKRALFALFDDPNVREIDPEELAGDYPAVEYAPPHGRYSMDILTRLGEAFSWQDLAAGSDEIELGDLVVRVASPQMLYRMKKDTVRPQDRADAARIREAFGLEEE
jgi:Nucleotidyl transferase AbiEii toxin, Type IV TA system